MLVAEVKSYNGTPALYLNGKPETGIMQWHRWPQASDAANFRKIGVHLFSVMGNIWLGEEHEARDKELRVVADRRMPSNHLSPAHIDSLMRTLLEGNPDVLVLFRIRLLPPLWWVRENPGEMMRHYNVQTGAFEDGLLPAVTSRAWTQLAMAALEETVRYCEDRWGDRIIGYHTGWGDCAEHAYSWDYVLSDYSRPQEEAFREWLAFRYVTVEALRESWKIKDVTFACAGIPTPQQRVRRHGEAALYDPQTQMHSIDYQTFHSEAMAASITRQASCVKNCLRHLGREKLFGTFYLYGNFSANDPQCQYNTGHDAHESILRNTDIDFICCPLGYATRQSGGSVTQQVLVRDILAHGKLYYAEDDTGTPLSAEWHHGFVPKDADAGRQISRRNFLDIWSSGGTLWWMDLQGAGWFRDETVLEEFALLKRFADATFSDRRSIAEVAVFRSDSSANYLKFDEQCCLASCLSERQRQEIASMGAPYDLFRLEDIEFLAERKLLDQYKFCIFLDAITVSDRTRNTIWKHLACCDRTLLWLYVPGLIREGTWDAAASSDLTGLKLLLARDSGRSALTVEALVANFRYTFGSERNLSPRLIGNDEQADCLGYYVESSGTQIPQSPRNDAPALLVKAMDGWRTIWSGAPAMPSELLMRFAREAGVHLYETRGDQIYAGKNWVGVHAKFSGAISIQLPAPAEVVDAVDGKRLPCPDGTIHLNMKRGETRMFYLYAGA